MAEKYQVPAVLRANEVLRLIAAEPARWKLMELSRRLNVNKSSMYAMLTTLERMRWVDKLADDTYALGSAMGEFGGAYFRQHDYIAAFHREAGVAKRRIGETFQLGKLEGREVVYLAKEEADTPVRLASSPGMRFPAHATALGKAMLAGLPEETWLSLYPDGEPLRRVTPHSLPSRDALFAELRAAAAAGVAYDLQEGVLGFCCVAAPVVDSEGRVIAGVSCSMTVHEWERKQQQAEAEVREVAKRISASRQRL
ncbi:transcriptional regulator [Paenibacillus cisolokensis]|uniref:Transcriptional regulator n=1 Tax=Paenibacillus cisolokensis TaxID=1658519 RepID=A0ABQ4NEF7_9BACL|nr:IclR family transcriptional regulator [Paenibacillus cisolokensis]GIQ66617.1 transcriptional regulator [Paenibacillus cisolokensis]